MWYAMQKQQGSTLIHLECMQHVLPMKADSAPEPLLMITSVHQTPLLLMMLQGGNKARHHIPQIPLLVDDNV